MDKVAVAIVGGGMVGAALALLLARVLPARQICLVESFPMPAADQPLFQPSFDDRSTAIAAGSVSVLEQAGVWPRLAEHATPIHQVHVSDRGHLGGALMDRHDMGVQALGYVIPNAWIGRTLLSDLQNLDNVTVMAPATVTRLTPIASGAQLQIRHRDRQEQTLQAELTVIADGAQSPLREALGIGCTVKPYGQVAIIANIALEGSHHCVAYERFTDTGPMALLPLSGREGNSAALVWTHPADEAEAILALDDTAFLALLQQRFGYRLGRFTGVGKREAYPLALMLADEQIRSSIAIMGNAAHFLHPVAGQGFNLALRDCVALASALTQAAPGESLGSLRLLQQYVQEQEADQATTIYVSDQLTQWFSTNKLSAAVLRALGFIGLESLPAAKQWFTRQTMGAAGKTVFLP